MKTKSIAIAIIAALLAISFAYLSIQKTVDLTLIHSITDGPGAQKALGLSVPTTSAGEFNSNSQLIGQLTLTLASLAEMPKKIFNSNNINPNGNLPGQHPFQSSKGSNAAHNAEVPSNIQTPVSSLKSPEEKIHPKIKGQVDAALQSSPDKKIKVILQATGEQSFERIAEQLQLANANLIGEYSIGDIIVAEIPANKIMGMAQEDAIDSFWPEEPVFAADEQSALQMSAQSAWVSGITGDGISIAILDSGIDGERAEFTGKVIASEKFVDSTDASDNFGHGNHVAGIAAASKENGGQISGIAPDALLLNGKVLDDKGAGTNISVIAGINWAVNNGANIINLSLCSHQPAW